MPELKRFYLSLCRELCGYCVPVIAYGEMQVRKMAVDCYGRMWCSVYEDPKGMIVIGEDADASDY